MADGYASQHLSPHLSVSWKKQEFIFVFLNHLFKSRHSYFGRRLHHKVIVIDNRFAMVGGINISNHYNDLPDQPGWLDFALYMEGKIVHDLCRICQKIWQGYLPAERLSLCRRIRSSLVPSPQEECQLRVRRNDWIMKKNQVSRSYIEMFRNADEQIIMMSGYFLPGPIIRKNMRKATARGVKIKLILAGMSDVMVAKNAERLYVQLVVSEMISKYTNTNPVFSMEKWQFTTENGRPSDHTM